MEDLKNIIECLLFVAEEPLSINNMKKVLPEADVKDIRQALTDLSEAYDVRKGGFYLNEVAGGFQLRTRPEYREWITKLIQPSPLRLSKAALETLAIIAYRQPVIRNDIEHIRGVDSGGIIRNLLERKLIKVLGRKEIPGRPLIYTTTKHFLEVFNLKDLRDLPTPKEITEMGKELPEAQKTDLEVVPTDEVIEEAGHLLSEKIDQEPFDEPEDALEPEDETEGDETEDDLGIDDEIDDFEEPDPDLEPKE